MINLFDMCNIFVALTYRCNAFCKKCMTRYHKNLHRDMDIDTLNTLIYKLKYHNYKGKISVGTGEPFLYPEINTFINSILDINDYISLRLLTNGMLLSSNNISRRIFDGRCKIGITLDAFKQETASSVQQGVNIEQVRRNIKHISKTYGGDCLYVNYTLYENNIDEFIPFCNFAIECGIRDIYLTELKVYSSYEKDLNEYRVIHDHRLENVLQEATKLLEEHGLSSEGIQINKRSQRDKCFLTNKASPVIDTDGSISLCGGREDVYVGNIKDIDIETKYVLFASRIRNTNNWCRYCHDRPLPGNIYSLPNTIIKDVWNHDG